tara:strand:+ start:105 stop:428 length:324 start_codon:yes stop_codon:yes gene_type:complete
VEKNYLEDLFDTLSKKKNKDEKNSYTSKLIKNPNLLSKKIGEESVEVIIEILNKDKDKLINESADLLYHLIVSWIYLDINPKNIWDELKQREVNLEINKKRKTPNGL